MKNTKAPSVISFCLLLLISLSGCKVYRQNIILKSDNEINEAAFETELSKVEAAYPLKVGDRLNIEVFTNKGERVFDPNLELSQGGAGMQGRPNTEFQIFPDSTLMLPVIGAVEPVGYSVEGLQEMLIEEFRKVYIDPYVRVNVINRRVIVLGALGGQVVPLQNENMNLLEVLALAGGLNRDAKGGNIRLIRGDLSNPSVQLINLHTIDGMQKANLDVLPGDVIYVEPVRRVFNETLRDVAPVIGLVTNVITLLIVTNVIN